MILKWALEFEEKARAGGRCFLRGKMEQKIHSHSPGTRAVSHDPLGKRCLYIGQEESQTRWGEVQVLAPMPLDGIGWIPVDP